MFVPIQTYKLLSIQFQQKTHSFYEIIFGKINKRGKFRLNRTINKGIRMASFVHNVSSICGHWDENCHKSNKINDIIVH